MPLFDYKCTKCEAIKEDEFIKDSNEKVLCDVCGAEMEKLPSNFAFTMTPGSISKFKKKYGKSVPPEYKTGAGANVYGIPRKR